MKNIRQRITQHKKELDKIFRKEGIVLAYLFGSQARGTAGTQSDVDIAVFFLQEPKNCFGRRISLALDIEKVTKIKNIEIVCLQEAPPLLKHRAVLSGKLFYAGVPSVKRDMELRSLQEYEDFKYHLAVANKALRRHIVQKMLGKAPLPSYNPHNF